MLFGWGSKAIADDGDEEKRALALRARMTDLYESIPQILVDRPDLQKACLGHLKAAEDAFTSQNMISCRMALADIDVEMTVVKREKFATWLTSWVVYAVVAMAILGAVYEPETDRLLHTKEGTIAGIPREIWIWALLGAACAMLLRVSQYNFLDRQEATRWAISRPLVGMVMGGLAFMILKMGLLVVDAPPDGDKMVYLNMVVAFLGGFSDSLSVTLLSKLQSKLTGNPNNPAESEKKAATEPPLKPGGETPLGDAPPTLESEAGQKAVAVVLATKAVTEKAPAEKGSPDGDLPSLPAFPAAASFATAEKS